MCGYTVETQATGRDWMETGIVVQTAAGPRALVFVYRKASGGAR